MPCPPCRFLWHRRLALAVLAPVVIWGLIVTAAPTEWARRRIEAELSEAAHCPAQVASVRFLFLGGVRLDGVTLGEPGERTPAWLRADHVRVDFGLVSLAIRGPTPRRVAIDGLDLRVGRDADGRFPLAELLRSGPGNHRADLVDPDGASDANRPPIAVQLRRGRIRVEDAPSRSSFAIADLSADATLWPRVIQIERLEGQTSGGALHLAMEIECGPDPAFDLSLRADGLQLDGSVPALALLLPFLGGVDASESGLLAIDFDLKGRGHELKSLRRSLQGRGRVRIDPVRLDRSRLTGELARLIALPETKRLGSLSSEFVIADERVTTPALCLGAGGRKLRLDGSTTFDGAISYQIEAQGLADDLSREVGNLLRRLPTQANGLVRLEVRGTIAEPDLLLNGEPIGDGSTEDPLEELGRVVRERFLR